MTRASNRPRAVHITVALVSRSGCERGSRRAAAFSRGRSTGTSTAGLLVAEWTFRCTWQNAPVFEGATIAISNGPQIKELRKYATTAPHYDWEGAWIE